MKIENVTEKTCRLLFCIFLLFALTNCSAKYNVLSWIKFWDTENKNDRPKEKEITEFISHVRPYQGNPDSHYLLAGYYQARGKHKEAIEEFTKVISIEPNYAKAYNGLGVSYDSLGDYSTAVEYYKKALNINSNLDYVKNNLGYSYLLQGKIEEAITVFKEALGLNYQNKQIHNNLGLAYAINGQFDFSLSEFKLATDEATAHYNIAYLLYKKGLFSEAKKHYAEALALNPSVTNSTHASNRLEAAAALSRISQPTDKVESKESSPTDQSLNKKSDKEELTTLPDKTEENHWHDSRKDVDIRISKANRVNQIAKKSYNHSDKRIKVIKQANASHFNNGKTNILTKKEYRKFDNYEAQHISRIHSLDIIRIKISDQENMKVKIFIGQHSTSHNKCLYFTKDYEI